MPYVTDTHTLIWYMTDDPNLSIKAKSRKIPRETVADPWDRLIAATSMHLNFL